VKRRVRSPGRPIELQELKGRLPDVSSGFFSRYGRNWGSSARELDAHGGLADHGDRRETRSFKRAAHTLRHGVDLAVSAKSVERVVHEVGRELERDAMPRRSRRSRWPASRGAPDLAVVECDGGRIRTREPGQGPGVHRTGEGWRENKKPV